MISVEKCRELLGDAGLSLTDEEILTLRDQLYVLADIALDIAQKKQKESSNSHE